MIMTCSLLFWFETCRLFYFYFRYWMRCSSDMLRISFLLPSISWIHMMSYVYIITILIILFIWWIIKDIFIQRSEWYIFELNTKSDLLIEKDIWGDFWFPLSFEFFPFFVKIELLHNCVVEDCPSLLVYPVVVDVVAVFDIFSQVADHSHQAVL